MIDTFNGVEELSADELIELDRIEMEMESGKKLFLSEIEWTKNQTKLDRYIKIASCLSRQSCPEYLLSLSAMIFIKTLQLIFRRNTKNRTTFLNK